MPNFNRLALIPFDARCRFRPMVEELEAREAPGQFWSCLSLAEGSAGIAIASELAASAEAPDRNSLVSDAFEPHSPAQRRPGKDVPPASRPNPAEFGGDRREARSESSLRADWASPFVAPAPIRLLPIPSAELNPTRVGTGFGGASPPSTAFGMLDRAATLPPTKLALGHGDANALARLAFSTPNRSFSSQEPMGFVYQNVPLNMDNDNGSPVETVPYAWPSPNQVKTYELPIPTLRDFNAGATPSENDLVRLNVIWVIQGDPPNPWPVAYPSVIGWKLDCDQSAVAGKVKFWTTPEKTGEILADGTWRDGTEPPIYLEGVNPSFEAHELVVYMEKVEVFSDGTVIRYLMRPVVLTVTPVFDALTITFPENERATLSNGYFGSTSRFTGRVYLGEEPTAPKGALQFIQNVFHPAMLMNNGTAGLLTPSGALRKLAIKPGVGPNNTYELLDTPPQPTVHPPGLVVPYATIPFYPSHPPLNPDAPGYRSIRGSDHPGQNLDDVQALDYREHFRLWLVWAHEDPGHNEKLTIWPMAYQRWQAHIIGSVVPPLGFMGPNSQNSLLDGVFQTHDASFMQLLPAVANGNREWIPV